MDDLEKELHGLAVAILSNESEEYMIPDAVKDQYETKIKEIHQLCVENGIPFVAVAQVGRISSDEDTTIECCQSTAYLDCSKRPSDTVYRCIHESKRNGVPHSERLQALN